MRASAVVAASVLVARLGVAAADSHAEAVALFDQGIKDMKAGQLDKACPELAASLALVKDSGTKGALARCHGLAGRIASAWLLWRELADTAPTAELRADAGSQAAKLEPRLPRYQIKLARPRPQLVVQINGRDVAANVAVAVPIDPGPLSVTASERDGSRVVTASWNHGYVAVEGQTVAIEVPELVPRPSVVPAAPREPPIVTSAGPVEPNLRDNDPRLGRKRLAVALGAVALGVAAAGVPYGLAARGRFADARAACGGAIDHCDPAQLASAQSLVDQARTYATISTVMFGVAGACAVSGTVLWLTTPSADGKSAMLAPSIGPGSVGVVLGGAF